MSAVELLTGPNVRRAFLLCLTASLFHSCASGYSSNGFINANLEIAYIALSAPDGMFLQRWGAATVVAPGIAVTNAHNSELVPAENILGVSREYDLLYFLTERMEVPSVVSPELNQAVISYGHGPGSTLREARGEIESLTRLAPPRCPDCAPQHTVMFRAVGGEGFSGGPVADATTGEILGVVFGFRDIDIDGTRAREMYAYSSSVIFDEMNRLLGSAATAVGPPP